MPTRARTLREGEGGDFFRVLDATAKRAAKPLEAGIRRGFDRSGKRLLTLLATLDPLQAVEVQDLWTGLYEGLIGLYGADGPIAPAMLEAGRRVAGLVRVDWGRSEQGFVRRALGYLDDRGAERVTAVTEETRLALRRVAKDVVEKPANLRRTSQAILKTPGLGLDQRQMREYEREVERILARAKRGDITPSQAQLSINSAYKRKVNHRARRIALTEAANAANASADLSMREMVAAGDIDEADFEWEWVTRAIGACPICEALDGSRRALTGGEFESKPIASGTLKGKTIKVERPTVHPFCYCGMQSVRRGAKRVWGWRLTKGTSGVELWQAHRLAA